MTASSMGWMPLFLSAEPVKTGHDLALEGSQAQAAAYFVDRELLTLEVLVRELVVRLSDGLDHGVAMLLGLGLADRPGSRPSTISSPRSVP